RRHAHRRHHRSLHRHVQRHSPVGEIRRDQEEPHSRFRRRDKRRHPGRDSHAGPVLSGRLAGGSRPERGDDRIGPLRRGTSHGGEDSVQRCAIGISAGTGPAGRQRTCGFAEDVRVLTAVILYCATSNPGKLREFQRAAVDFEIRALTPAPEPPDETGATFEENAILKAVYYSRFADGPLFADDSGLEVDALGGAPGVHSARYAGPEATDAENNALLLDHLKTATNRAGRFVCAIALAEHGKLIRTFRGTVEGRILD